jgi:hypothetical protein
MQRRQLDSFDLGYEPMADFCKHVTKASDFIKTGGFNDYSALPEMTTIREIITLNYYIIKQIKQNFSRLVVLLKDLNLKRLQIILKFLS